jgi:hypothetical protein
MTNTPEYRAWMHIKTRCYNPNTPYYDLYGGRGIKMADEWREDFSAFLGHVGLRPSTRHSIDRIDNAGHYVPGNVQWATPRQQINNRRTTIRLTLHGETLPLADWSRRLGIKEVTIKARLARGWPIPLALSPIDFRTS